MDMRNMFSYPYMECHFALENQKIIYIVWEIINNPFSLRLDIPSQQILGKSC